jgi:hypothetical protein
MLLRRERFRAGAARRAPPHVERFTVGQLARSFPPAYDELLG